MIPPLGGDVAELLLPPAIVMLGIARAFVGAVAASAPGLDASRVDDVRLATSEAVANAVTAQQRVGCADRIVVRCCVDGPLLVVEVIDRGGGVVEPVGVVADASDLDGGGLGIPLIRALADTVVFGEAPGGTVVRLAFRLQP